MTMKIRMTLIFPSNDSSR